MFGKKFKEISQRKQQGSVQLVSFHKQKKCKFSVREFDWEIYWSATKAVVFKH